ncbi:hypothetical protein [Caldithrix abyssi]
MIVIEGDLGPLRKKLRKGEVIKGRIVLTLSDDHYLLRLMGRNLIMKSRVRFERKQEVYFKVLSVSPKIELKIFDLQRELLVNSRRHLTDIIA